MESPPHVQRLSHDDQTTESSRKPPTDVDIVETDMADLHTIRSLWEELNEFNNLLHRKCFGVRLSKDWEDESRDLLGRAQECSMRFHVAMIHEDMVGYCLSSINKAQVGQIISVFVRPGQRGRGIGWHLVNEHMTWFRDNSVKSIFLYVHPCNCDAIRFYWKFNFFSNSPLMEVCEQGRTCTFQ